MGSIRLLSGSYRVSRLRELGKYSCKYIIRANTLFITLSLTAVITNDEEKYVQLPYLKP